MGSDTRVTCLIEIKEFYLVHSLNSTWRCKQKYEFDND
jgi:hypothetical protein